MNVIAGNLAFSGTASIGAAAGVPIVTKVTEAYIGQNARVDAKGKAAPTAVETGLSATTTPTTFDPQTAVQPDHTSINLGYVHGFSTGEAVYYYPDGGKSIGNLPSTSPAQGSNPPAQIVYYVIVVNPTTIQLATSQANAMNDVPITGLDATQAMGNMHRIVPTTEVSVQNVGGSSTDSNANSVAGSLLTLTGQTLVSPTINSQFQGVAVTAMNHDQIATAGVSGGGAGNVAVNVGGSVDVMSSQTLAHIDQGAQINPNNGDTNDVPGATQSVLVAAANNYQQVGIAGAVAISGSVSAAPGADIRVVNNTTKAYIGDGTLVNAIGDVQVLAHAAENVLSIAAGIAGSGEVAVGGAVGVTVVNDTTWATIGSNTAATPGAGATVNAGGNVAVIAADDTTYNAFTGAAGIGIGAAGIGASVGVLVIGKDTEAYVGNNSIVNANANSTNTLNNINQDENTATGTVNQVSIKGLAVQASSSEKMFTAAIAGGIGFYAGIAGAVSVEIVGSNTTAYIGQGSVVNAATVPGRTRRSTSRPRMTPKTPRPASAWVVVSWGSAAAVDVGLVRNNTSAYIGGGATVNATGDVNVNALSKKNVQTSVLSASTGRRRRGRIGLGLDHRGRFYLDLLRRHPGNQSRGMAAEHQLQHQRPGAGIRRQYLRGEVRHPVQQRHQPDCRYQPYAVAKRRVAGEHQLQPERCCSGIGRQTLLRGQRHQRQSRRGPDHRHQPQIMAAAEHGGQPIRPGPELVAGEHELQEG